jgi:hypothetical protein
MPRSAASARRGRTAWSGRDADVDRVTVGEQMNVALLQAAIDTFQVHQTRRAEAFPKFYEAFSQAYQQRLDGLGIARYRLTEVGAIEAAAFELADSVEHA